MTGHFKKKIKMIVFDAYTTCVKSVLRKIYDRCALKMSYDVSYFIENHYVKKINC